MSIDTSLTLRSLSLGARDTYTGWCTKTFTESTIYGVCESKGGTHIAASHGFLTSKPYSLWTQSPIKEDDEIITADGKYLRVKTVNEAWFANRFEGYFCGLDYAEPHYDRPASSGSWHTDSDSTVTDVNYRTKVWLDTYLAAVNGTDQVMLAYPDYSLKREFVDNSLDVIAFIETAPSSTLSGEDKKPYAFEETATIHLAAINKTNLTAKNILEEYEQAIRHVASDYPIGSIRQINATRYPSPDNVSGLQLFKTDITLRYKRANDDYAGTSMTLTWGPSAAPTGTFTFPNCTYISPPSEVTNMRLLLPGRMGNHLQKLGMPDYMITTRHDLDMEPSDLTWKRPQTTTPKSDDVNWQVFWDIQFNGQYSAAQTYQTLDLGYGSTLQVTLEKVTPTETPEGTELELTFAVYNSATATDYTTFFGLS